MRIMPFSAPSSGMRTAAALLTAALLCSAATHAQSTSRPTPLPATPADERPAQQTAPEKSPQTTPPADQQQQPTAETPVATANSTLGTVPVPEAVPSMMPHEPGEEVDRVVALVNGKIVLDSDVDEEHRFEAIQPYPNAVGTQPTRAREVERLINRELILQQARLETQDNITAADVDKEIANLRSTLPGCKPDLCATDAGWSTYLAGRGFSAAEFRIRWQQRMEVKDLHSQVLCQMQMMMMTMMIAKMVSQRRTTRRHRQADVVMKLAFHSQTAVL